MRMPDKCNGAELAMHMHQSKLLQRSIEVTGHPLVPLLRNVIMQAYMC